MTQIIEGRALRGHFEEGGGVCRAAVAESIGGIGVAGEENRSGYGRPRAMPAETRPEAGNVRHSGGEGGGRASHPLTMWRRRGVPARRLAQSTSPPLRG